MNKALHEVMTTRTWDFYPESFRAYREVFKDNIATRKPFVRDEQREDRPFTVSSRDGYAEKTYIGNTDYLDFSRLEPEDRVVCVISILGPVLRNGDLCSYGSKEHRDIIMRAADDPHTDGFLILVDSPGGSSMAKYDYEMALSYAKSKKKSIIGLVDGMACSAGYAPLALCDEVYFTEPHDVVGCIGTMCAMYTLKDGDINSITQERYVEVYADDSPYKNKEYRDAAQGNYDELRTEINGLCKDFQQMVKTSRPSVTDEQLKGRTYPAGEVIGTMVDGQGTFESCIERIQELAGKQPSTPDQTKEPAKQQESHPGNASETAQKPEEINNQQSQTQNQADMEKKNYPFIQSAAGVHALVADESNGIYLVEDMADTLEDRLAKADRNESTLAAKLTENKQLNETIEQLKKEHAEATEKASADHASELESLKADHEKALNDKEAELKAANERIASLEAELKELSERTSHQPAPQNPPKDNALKGAQEGGFKVSSVCDENLSWAEKVERMNQRKEELARKGCQ